MTPHLFIDIALKPALGLLPLKMSSPAAMAMVVAICLQESGLTYRHQVRGPAVSYLQFERDGGVHGVLTHHLTSALAAQVCRQFDIPPDSTSVYLAIEYQDVLACVFGRLLLWTLPQALPQPDETQNGWDQYVSAWRPGAVLRPDVEPAKVAILRNKWTRNYEQAWLAVADATAHA